MNALPKTITVKKVIKAVPTTTTTTTTTTEREPTTTTTTEKEPTTITESEPEREREPELEPERESVDVAPQYIPVPEREAALSGNELTEEDSAALASIPEVTFPLSASRGQAPWGAQFGRAFRPEVLGYPEAKSDTPVESAEPAGVTATDTDDDTLQNISVSSPTPIAPSAPASPSEPPSDSPQPSETPEAKSGRRQARLLAGHADRHLWSDLRSGTSEASAVEDQYVALQREVVRRQQGFPLTAAVIVVAALSVTVIAAGVIGTIVYRRKSSGRRHEGRRGWGVGGKCQVRCI